MSQLFCERYTPTNLKQLFNRNIVAQLKKKLTNLNCKTLIFVNGPLGCGKTVTIKLLLKKFNVIHVNPDDCDFSFVDSNQKTFSKNPTIILIDQAELFEKQVSDVIKNDLLEKGINIPIIVVTNNLAQHESFTKKEYSHFFSAFSFGKPSLLELYKLIYDINVKETLNLKEADIHEIIKISDYDIQFIFSILQQWSLNKTNFNTFIKSYGQKDKILSPNDLIQNAKICDFHTFYNNSFSHSFGVSNLIYENLPHLVNNISMYSDISECMSYSEKIISQRHFWEIHHIHAINSCVIPLTIISNSEPVLSKDLRNFKDIPLNYLNSLNVVYNNTSNLPKDISSCSQICQLLLSAINQLSEYANKTIKMNNVSKKSIVNFCTLQENTEIQNIVKYLVDNIIYFKLFEYTDYIPLHNDHDQILKLFQNVKFNVLKRFLNIFTLDYKSHNYKTLPSKTECILKYEIFNELIRTKQTTVKSTSEVDKHAELSSIWNL
jgi:hypothetical protein